MFQPLRVPSVPSSPPLGLFAPEEPEPPASPLAPRPSPLAPLFAPAAARPGLAQPPAHDAPLVEGIARYLLRKEQEGDAERSLKDIRYSAWFFLEFLQEAAERAGRGTAADLLIGDLPPEVGSHFLDWLRTTPAYNRRRGSYPTQISVQSVRAFYTYCTPPKRFGAMRGPATIHKQWTNVSGLLRWLKLPIEVERRKRQKCSYKLPPIVPELSEIAARWREILTTTAGRATPAERRQVVLTQALILLWGTRLQEALLAAVEDLDGHWCLVMGKRGMRMCYLNSQALGIVAALRGQKTMPWAAQRWSRISGWPWGLQKWHHFVRDCGVADGKQQQSLRARWTSWVKPRDAEVEMAMAGHGGGVVFAHYLDTLRNVAPVLEQFALPAVDAPGFAWPEPVYPHRPAEAAEWTPAKEAAACNAAGPPFALYARFRKWAEQQQQLAAQPR